MAKKLKETHISTTPDVREKLKAIAEFEQRAMRTILKRVVEAEYKKVFEK